MTSDEVIQELSRKGFHVEAADASSCGYHLGVILDPFKVRLFAETLLSLGFFIDFLTAVDLSPTIQLIYQFAHFEMPCRINARVSLPESGGVETISDIYQGADWHEREAKDFFGVVFKGHPNLTPLILCDEDHDLKPLLKKEGEKKSLEEVGW
ncbi:MAG: NADH-quinone oxidoreductase subunit C [Desulfobacterales bacterium]|nr:NADH-quinone oxidoreductase subunit C [Desulfobacterales bacterium]